MLLLAPVAFSQSRETGAIRGTVKDDQGAPLPGVGITLTGVNLMGTRTFLTDANGEFRFPALPPGEYQVKAVLTGFGTVSREKIRLSTTTTLAVDIELKATTMSEEVTVIAQTPTVDVKSTETASVTLGSEILRSMPNSQFTADIVNMAPGVNNDVAYGAANGRGISYQMDGVGVADPDGGTAWVFLSYNIVEEAKIMGIGLPAEYGNFTGVIFNIVTKSGGNKFSGHFETIFQGKKGRGDLEGTWPGGSLWGTENNQAYAEDWPLITSPLEGLLDTNAQLGGPIVKDKLWFFGGAQWYRSQNWVTGFPFAQDYKQPRFFLKLNSQLTSKTTGSLSFEYDDYNGTYRGAGARVQPDATRNQIDPEMVLNFNLTHIINPKTFFDVKAAYFDGYYNLEPRTGRDVNMHWFLNDNPDLSGDQANWKYYSWGSYGEFDRSRFQANASMTHYAEDFLAGSHDFKFGVEFEKSKVKNLFSYTGENHWRYYDYWGGGYSGNYYAYEYEGYQVQTRNFRLEGFAQDSWKVSSRLNISLGVRFSKNWGKHKELTGVQFSTFRVAPRLGFTFDILGDKSTILKAHFGEFTDGMFSSLFDRLSPTFSDWTIFYWDPAYTDQSDPNGWYEYYRRVHGTWVIDEGVKHPFMRQYTVGLERELFKDASFSVTYINRSYHNFITPYNALATYEPYIYNTSALNTETNEVENRSYTLFNLTSGDDAEWHITNVETIKDLYSDVTGSSYNPYRKYWGLEFIFNKRFSDRWQLLASYVYGRATGTMDNSSAWDDIGWNEYADPNTWINLDGHVTQDPTHMIKVQGTYLLPLDIGLSIYFRGISGDAWTQRKRGPSLDQGRVTFNAEAAGKYHYPMATTLDIRLVKEFKIAAKYRLGLMADIFNVLNDDTINGWGTRFNYDWYDSSNLEDYTASTDGHQLNSIVLPRRLRVGVRLMF